MIPRRAKCRPSVIDGIIASSSFPTIRHLMLMATARLETDSPRTLAELLAPLGGVPLDRIRAQPAPGSGTVQDVVDILDREGVLCELVGGVLVEKPVGYSESLLATVIV